jgi:chorismate dehydratase
MSTAQVKVGIVNYLNTLPLRYGLQQMAEAGQITLQQDYPSKIAKALMDGDIDLGLVPVAALLHLPNPHIRGEYCISANGPVASVGLYSQAPLNEIKKIYLDYQSKSSVRLVQILCNKHWQISPEFIQAPDNFIDLINADTAAVIIGDRALQHKHKFQFEFDLAEAWKQHTGLPFVFAVWVSTKEIADEFVIQFDEANGVGFNFIDEIVANADYEHYDLKKYFTENIEYKLSDDKRKAIELFLSPFS